MVNLLHRVSGWAKGAPKTGELSSFFLPPSDGAIGDVGGEGSLEYRMFAERGLRGDRRTGRYGVCCGTSALADSSVKMCDG